MPSTHEAALTAVDGTSRRYHRSRCLWWVVLGGVLMAMTDLSGREATDDDARLAVPIAERGHPFLLCERAQFPELRARAEREPWRAMVAAARERVAEGPPEVAIGKPRLMHLQRYLGAVALLAIVDEAQREDRVGAIRDAILTQVAAMEVDPEQQWAGVVAQMGVAFTAILALDIVHDELTEADRAACETVIAEQIAKVPEEGSWPAARWGTHRTWAIYRGERDQPDDEFLANYLRQMTLDGVNTVSPNYAFARLGSEDGRLQKTVYADVLEFTGIDRRYYDHPRIANFYRWLFAHCVTPAKECHAFGDAIVTSRGVPRAAGLWRVGRFDRRAAAHAAWLLEGAEPPGHVTAFLLIHEPLPEPEVPGSALYWHGGAFFREPADDPSGLGAMLYNVELEERIDWHAHEEVNALSFAAYGTLVLVNGGWLGDALRPPWRNNVLTIDGRRHQSQIGGGLVEGLTGDGLDYACGDAGDALGGDRWQRSLVLVHRRDGLGGYAVVIDEVTAEAGERIHSYLQLASQSPLESVADGAGFRAVVDHHPRVEGVALTVCYATAPEAVEERVIESGSLDRLSAAGHHRRLEAVYPLGAGGQRRLLTLLVPADAVHPAPEVARLEGEGFTGARLVFPDGTVDTILVATGEAPVRHAGAELHGRAVWYRERNGAVEDCFLRRATRFVHGATVVEHPEPSSSLHRGDAITPARRRDER